MRKLYFVKKLGLLLSLFFLFKITSLACSFSVELYDSYGDGWNGSSLTIFINGTPVLTDITLLNGSGPGIYTFEAGNGDEITTSYVTGSYAIEPWYEIKDPNGIVIAIDGDGGTIPQGISTPIIITFFDLDASINNIITNDYAGTNEIYVNLGNNGNDDLLSTTIEWELDGVAQTSLNWTGTLSLCGSQEVLLGSFTFEPETSYQIKVWSANPNGATDENTLNDTIILDVDISPNMTINTVTSFTNDTSRVFPSSENNEIFGFNINTSNISNPLSLDSIKLNTTGSDDFINDISSVKIYSTGNINRYNKTNIIWEGTNISSAIHFDIPLDEGNNFYWIAVNVDDFPTLNNGIQMACEFVTIDETEHIPTIVEPYGKRTIKEKTKYYNFMPASIVVGQPDFYTQNTTQDEYTGYGSVCSAASAKGVLAVGSMNYGRVLIYNSVPDTNGAPADVVIGNPNFYSANNGPTVEYMGNTYGLCFSPDGEKLIVSDKDYNRVLIWNSIPTSNAQPADVVIGQVNFTSSSSGFGPDKLNQPWGVFVSPDGKLLISDALNNRILIFNQIPTSNGASADLVIGQNDFNSNSPGVSTNKLYQPYTSAISNDGKLIISDRYNHRVLIFNEFPTENGASADVVLGQTDFYSNSPGLGPDKISYSWGVTVSPKGELAIGDWSNNRVLIYNEIPIENGANADIVLGQPDFNTSLSFNGGISEKSMYHPYGINYDLNGRLYVNGFMHRVMIFGDLPTDTADLQIAVSADKTNPHVGESISYTFTLTNNGPNSSSEIIVKSALPGLFNLENYDAEKGDYQPYGGTWTIPYMASGESIDLILDGTIEDGGGDITAYSNIIASSALDAIMSNNATSLTINVVNNAPAISTIENDTIVQETSTNWIPFLIGDTDSEMSKLAISATSSNQTIVPDLNIQLKGDDENRFIKITPLTNQSGAVDITLTVSDGYTDDQSIFELYIVSNNANLIDLDTTGVNITGFRADSLTYTCELTAGRTIAPTVTATAENAEATVNIYETDSIPGITTVEVIAEDGTVQNYLITFVLPVLADNDASLTDLKVDGTTITNFSPIRYHYTKNLPFGTAIVPNINAIAKNALATIDLKQTTALPGRDSIVVTAVDGVTEQVYTIDYVITSASDNNNLQKITIDGEEIVTFDPEVLDYAFEYPYGTTSVPMVIAVPEDANAFIDQTDAASMPGTTTLDVYAEDASLKTYTIEFTLAAPSEDASLKKIKVDGSLIFGFNTEVYSYDIELEPDVTEVPEVTATANNDSADVVINDASALPGTTSVIVTAQDGTTELTYNVNFAYRPLSDVSLLSDLKVNGVTINGFDPEIYSYMYKVPVVTSTSPLVTANVYDSKATKIITNTSVIPGTTTISVTAEDGSTSDYTVYFTFDNLSSDATLSDILFDGISISEFNSTNLVYNVELPYGTTDIPVVTPTKNNENASTEITDASSLPGTTTIEVTAEDEFTTKTYLVNFTIADPATDATLSNLKVDGTTVSSFNSSTFSYDVELDYGTITVPTVTATTTDANATASIVDATALPGSTVVTVTAEDDLTEIVYTINFTIAPNNDATLNDLKVDGTTVNGFNSSTLSYDIELESGTTTVPTLTATTNDINADAVITDATSLPGTTTILVTAEDETSEETYSINFTVATAIDGPDFSRNISLYPNPSNGIIHIAFEDVIQSEWKIEVYNSIGSIIYNEELLSINETFHKIDLSSFSKGMYFVKISTSKESCVKSLIIK
ncbi:MAG TPA: hypothetical protein DCG75_10290 [Bacteroidales bacterium]|nr:hypothetical protein [Bacteroidales bacterium]